MRFPRQGLYGHLIYAAACRVGKSKHCNTPFASEKQGFFGRDVGFHAPLPRRWQGAADLCYYMTI
jgi:hypothetical protein